MSDCIFCKIAARTIPSEIVYEDDQVLVFKDIHPLAPVHLLAIPKKHLDSLQDIKGADEPLLGHLLGIVKKLAEEFNVASEGYRVVTNIGPHGGQEVKHLHFHLMGGKPLGSKLG